MYVLIPESLDDFSFFIYSMAKINPQLKLIKFHFSYKKYCKCT